MKAFFTISIFFFLLNNSNAIAQQGLPKSPNEKAVDKSVIAGHFDMDKKNEQRGITEHINVNYALSGAPFTNYVKLDLSTAQPTLFSADIVDVKGQAVKHWAPQTKSHMYSETIDISSLTPGDYKVNFYSELGTSLIYSVSFRKEKTN